MENISQKTEYPCSGCGACAAACPNGAIRLELDEAGFYSARVEDHRCVNCGLCVRLCPRFETEIRGADLRRTKLYALQSADGETVRRCSSGGLAHELALETLRRGGEVVGAVYDLDANAVRHEIVRTAGALSRLDGSKYLQSNPQAAFTETVARAGTDPALRFTVFGTPCQIAGLAKLCELHHIRERFLLVEIFCHGVPSYKLWAHQAERMKKKLGADRFDSLQFRYKKDDWHSYCLRAEANGRVFYGSRERELFWQVFFENVLLGDACMTCRLRKETSAADLRIGDYWGKRYQSRRDGVSAAFACTQRGEAAIEALLSAGRLRALEPGTPEEMLRAQNMAGYRELRLHAEATALLREGRSLRSAISSYRRHQPLPQRVKRLMLRGSGLLPSGIRARLKKRYSASRLGGD